MRNTEAERNVRPASTPDDHKSEVTAGINELFGIDVQTTTTGPRE